MLAKTNRLAKANDFKKTFKQGRSLYNEFLGVKAVANQRLNNRYGIVISAKVSKKAVERNKLKRQIRAVLRKFDNLLEPGYDLIIIALPTALNQKYEVLAEGLEKIMLKLRLFKRLK